MDRIPSPPIPTVVLVDRLACRTQTTGSPSVSRITPHSRWQVCEIRPRAYEAWNDIAVLVGAATLGPATRFTTPTPRVDPSAVAEANFRISADAVIGNLAKIRENTRFGKARGALSDTSNSSVYIDDDTQVAEGVTIEGGAMIGGKV